jgi:hypothetical protein
MNSKILNFVGLLGLVAAMTSCLKDKGYDDQKYGTIIAGTPSSSQRSVKILQGGSGEGDIGRSKLIFADPSAALDSSLITLAYVDYKSPVAPATITLTLGVDPAFVTAHNVAFPTGVQYELMPDSLYTLPGSTTIKAGETYSPDLKIYFKPNKFNSSKTYMLPIKILSATGVEGVQVQANYGYIVYTIIGNSLAGKYSWRYRRWQGADTTVAPLQDLLATVNLTPVSATQLLTRETYTETFIDPAGGIVLNFTQSGGTLSNFNLTLLPSTIAAIPAGGFTLANGPTFATGGAFTLVGNATTNYIGTKFSTYIQYINSTPAFRSLVNSFVKIP